MSTNSLNAAVAVDFSLIGTSLHAMYKKETKGYKILLIPTLQTDNDGVSIADLIKDIKNISKNITGTEVNTDEISKALDGATEGKTSEKPEANPSKMDVNNIRICLKMAYLYISNDGTESKENNILEYAFNLDITTTGLIPKALSDIVTVDHIGIAVWNTERTAILNNMSIAKIEDYLGLPAA